MENKTPQNQIKKLSKPFSIGTDLVSGVLVGLVIGISIDKWLETKPVFMIICLMLGVLASLKMIWREMK